MSNERRWKCIRELRDEPFRRRRLNEIKQWNQGGSQMSQMMNSGIRWLPRSACMLAWLATAVLGSALALATVPVEAAEITLIHMGDVHGHMMPRPSARGETT